MWLKHILYAYHLILLSLARADEEIALRRGSLRRLSHWCAYAGGYEICCKSGGGGDECKRCTGECQNGITMSPTDLCFENSCGSNVNCLA